jgi:serine/threonine-protein kinase
MVMEYIDGQALDELPKPWTPEQVERFLRTMLQGLAQLHNVGIIHRDLKPQNIKHTPQGRSPYILLDFGIAKQGGATSVKALSPDYAPIEQMKGEPTDARSDLYSLAATAYHMLTGQSPLGERVKSSGRLAPPSTFVPETPPYLDKTLMWMLEQEPDNRPPSAEAALQQLESKATLGQETQPGPQAQVPIWEQETRRAPSPSQPATPPPAPPRQPPTPTIGEQPTMRDVRPTPRSAPTPAPEPRRREAAPYPPEPYRQSGGMSKMIVGGVIALIVLLLAVGGVVALISQRGITPAADVEETPTPSPSPTTEEQPVDEATVAPEPTPIPEPTTEPTPIPPPTPEPPPRPAPPLGSIAFASNREGNFSIYVMDSSGEVRNITGGGANDYAPAWSPNGNRIAFHSNRSGGEHIFVVNADGSNLQQLTSENQNREPTWSPNGNRIAYMSGSDSNWDIYVMNANGSAINNLTGDSFAGDFAPDWSPNGR